MWEKEEVLVGELFFAEKPGKCAKSREKKERKIRTMNAWPKGGKEEKKSFQTERLTLEGEKKGRGKEKGFTPSSHHQGEKKGGGGKKGKESFLLISEG